VFYRVNATSFVVTSDLRVHINPFSAQVPLFNVKIEISAHRAGGWPRRLAFCRLQFGKLIAIVTAVRRIENYPVS